MKITTLSPEKQIKVLKVIWLIHREHPTLQEFRDIIYELQDYFKDCLSTEEEVLTECVNALIVGIPQLEDRLVLYKFTESDKEELIKILINIYEYDDQSTYYNDINRILLEEQ